MARCSLSGSSTRRTGGRRVRGWLPRESPIAGHDYGRSGRWRAERGCGDGECSFLVYASFRGSTQSPRASWRINRMWYRRTTPRWLLTVLQRRHLYCKVLVGPHRVGGGRGRGGSRGCARRVPGRSGRWHRRLGCKDTGDVRPFSPLPASIGLTAQSTRATWQPAVMAAAAGQPLSCVVVGLARAGYG